MTNTKSRLYPVAPAFDNADSLVANHGARDLASSISRGDIRSQDLVQECLQRIEQFDPALHAMIDVQARRALLAAKRADLQRSAGRFRGPFHGVPITVKDHHMVRATPTRIGSRAFRFLWSPVDDQLVKRLRRAGFIILGKTSMSELGILPIVETELQPATCNPWDTSRSAGGSSGGAGAGIAGGLFPFAQGSDGAGSVRIPSSFNGLVDLKPSRNLVPDDAAKINKYGLATDGPMARSIDDAADLLDIMSGQPIGTTLGASRASVPRLRIGVVLDTPFGEADPRILTIVEAAAAALEKAGHTLVPTQSPKAGIDDFRPLYQRFVARIPIVLPSSLGDFAAWFRSEGLRVPEEEATRIYKQFEELGARFMDNIDIALSATVGVLPPKVGEWAHLDPPALFDASASLGMYTALANVTGQPSLNVPFGHVEDIPIGVQLTGQHGDDALLFALARQLERNAS
jgi:amidase